MSSGILDFACMWAVVVLFWRLSRGRKGFRVCSNTHSLSRLMRSATHWVFLLWTNGAWNETMWFWHRIAASWDIIHTRTRALETSNYLNRHTSAMGCHDTITTQASVSHRAERSGANSLNQTFPHAGRSEKVLNSTADANHCNHGTEV